ncbi:MAG TPA: hypothetical protein VL332_00890 [Candidatus Saccharimonadaceae bacterium]|nr:hypothetical protein [Candidatus Saccharimonadaceae bacterium]
MIASDGDPNMTRSTCVASLCLLLGAGVPAAAQAERSRSAEAASAKATVAQINILTPALVLAPTATDYANNFVEAAGASGLQVQVKSNSITGMSLSVRSSGAPQIALADFLVRTTTDPGPLGFRRSTYTALPTTDLLMWSTLVRVNGWRTVTTDVRLQNIFNYNDAGGAGTTSYTNTLTYTLVVQ